MNQKRPVNLDLATMKFPAMAIASLLHRISGIVLFLLLPFMLYCLGMSLSSPESFITLQTFVENAYCKLVLWAFTAALIYHLLAGIRHIMMDMGFGEELYQGRLSAVWVIVLSIILTIFLGIWIW